MPIPFSIFCKSQRKVVEDRSFLCDLCGAEFSRTKTQVAYALYVGREKMFCSKTCQTAAQVTRMKFSCGTCGREFLKTRANAQRSRNHFCSSSCATKYSNRAHPKRIAQKHACAMPSCTAVFSGRRKFCKNCRVSLVTPATLEAWLKRWGTLGEMQARAKYQANAQVRGIARTVYRVLGRPKQCKICLYDKHIDVCHLRDICDFPPATPIALVNAPSNLVGLCRNHHWELDHELLSAQDRLKLNETLE